MDTKEIFEQALKDPQLRSTIDIDKLIESLEDERNNYLDNKSLNDINNDIFKIIDSNNIDVEKKKQYCEKLIGYYPIEHIYEIHKGKHIRWLRNGKLTNGGITVDIKFTDKGTQILCMNSNKRFIQIKLDECKIFQKMNQTEQLIIMAYEYANEK